MKQIVMKVMTTGQIQQLAVLSDVKSNGTFLELYR